MYGLLAVAKAKNQAGDANEQKQIRKAFKNAETFILEYITYDNIDQEELVEDRS
jgi:hypothetical protein